MKSMDGEASSFESSEMLATFVASTPLLWESWELCSHANANAPQSFVSRRRTDDDGVSYVAFSGVQTVNAGLDPQSCRSLVELGTAGNGLFSAFHRHPEEEEVEKEEPVKVHAGMLHLFLSIFNYTNFRSQIFEIMSQSKSVVFTGHSIGGSIASLSALWLLSYLQSKSSPLGVLCITFGSPLLGNKSLSRAILQERWGGNFCHVVAKHDIVPRLLFAPFTPHLHSLLQYWHLSMTSPYFRQLVGQLPDEEKNQLFHLVFASCVEASEKAGEGSGRNSFWPFGSYVFCTNEGAVCMDNAVAIVKFLQFMFATGSASSSIDDHLKYEDYVRKVSFQFLKSRGFFREGEVPKSSYEAGVTLSLQSSEIASHEQAIYGPAKDCLKTAKRMGRTPNLNSANLSIALSKITPLRAQIEWYKDSCDKSDDRLGYYDTFKLKGASRRNAKVNMNRIRLAQFWDELIRMLDTNQLPHDFLIKRTKFVNSSHFYKLLVEPLDIAEYYRTGKHRVKGHYLKHGRERRYEIFDRWWRNRKVGEEENIKRSRYASLTQDSCFWARVEEAREWLEKVRSECDTKKLSLLREIENFEQYAREMVDRKEVSTDVLAENSSYSLWMKEWRELKSQLQ